MKASKELVQHISTTFWDKSNKEIAQCLEDFKGNPLREEETPLEVKHPIERVNAKYPNGWYCEAFDEVREDMAEVTGKALFTVKWYWCGWNPKESNNLGYLATLYNSYKYCYDTVITKSEYLSITRGVAETPQEEKPTIHTSKPIDIEERVKALEKVWIAELLERIEALEDTPIIERKKRNLDIDTPTIDWKKVECLSWDDVKEIISSGISIENYIKNKLKSKATLKPDNYEKRYI